MPNDAKEVFYCMDEGQGFDHKCITFSEGMCSREIKCRYHLSPFLLEKFKNDLKEAEKRITLKIQNKLKLKIDEVFKRWGIEINEGLD